MFGFCSVFNSFQNIATTSPLLLLYYLQHSPPLLHLWKILASRTLDNIAPICYHGDSSQEQNLKTDTTTTASDKACPNHRNIKKFLAIGIQQGQASMMLDNFGGICYNGDSSTNELATIGDTMTITILIKGAEVVAISF